MLQRTPLVLAALLALCLPDRVASQQAASQQAAPKPDSFAVRCGVLHQGDGTTLEDAVMIVAGGRIQAVGAGAGAPAIPDGMTVVDASDRVVMPGIVAADSDLSGHGDSDYSVTPDFVALDGFDFLRPRSALLSGGVTTVYLAPGRNRLVSGQGSVVKTHGDLLLDRVLSETACLRLNMSAAATQAPAVFEPTVSPTSDDPLLPARKQFPSARISMLAELTRLFRGASEADVDGGDPGLAGPGPAENQFSTLPLQRAARGDLPLRIAAGEAADIRRALYLGKQLGARVVLENPWELHRLGKAAGQAHGAVFRVPVRPGQSNPGGENRPAQPSPARPDAVARAAAAGARVALAPVGSEAMADYLMVAGIAIRHGLSAEQAMRAITSDAAALLGVDDRTGTLAAGKDADFLVLSGAPFAIGTMVEHTFVGGARAWQRDDETSMLAVRCGKIYTMAGGTVRNGGLLAAGGKIKSVGEDLAAPYGARILDLGPDSVMVPGFIDAYTHVGLAGTGSGIPNGSADQRVADVIQPDDPMLADAASAGITTVLVSGQDSGPVSGRVSAIKTAGADHDAMVLREIAAIRMVHDGIGPDAMKPISDAVGRGKRYLETWQKYEKDLAAYKAGTKVEKPAASTPAPESGDAKPDPITGVWEVEFADPPPVPISITLELLLEGTKVTGSLIFSFQGREVPPAEITDGKFENGTVTARVRAPMMGDAEVTATVGDDTMAGTLGNDQMTQQFTAKRTTKPDGSGGGTTRTSAGKADDGAPKKPDIDEALEPLKALLEGKIPAVVRSNRAPALQAVLAWFEQEKLPLIVTGLKDAIESPEVLGDARPAALLGPDVVRRERGEVINAAARLADLGLPLALGTGDTAGARYLPLHAALAVRYGLGPNQALAALTIDAARMFKLDHRIGSLERGKDADFVVFDGNPFELTSRVQLVVVGGHVAYDAREGQR